MQEISIKLTPQTSKILRHTKKEILLMKKKRIKQEQLEGAKTKTQVGRSNN